MEFADLVRSIRPRPPPDFPLVPLVGQPPGKQPSGGCDRAIHPAAAQSPVGTPGRVLLLSPPPLLLRPPPAGGAGVRGAAIPAATFTPATIPSQDCADLGGYAPQSSERHVGADISN